MGEQVYNNEIISRRPIVSRGTHPIETGRYLIATNEINRLYYKLQQCINNRSPGALIYGRPRLGKTRAINYLMHLLPAEYQQIPIYFMRCKDYKNANENIFFQDLLKAVKHQIHSSGKADAKRDRLIKFLVERANSKNQKRIILFIDDAQWLHEQHYNWLMNVYNELDYAGFSLTVFLVGQEELFYQRSSFIETKKQQIIGRFMVHTYKFSGIKTKEDLMEVLAGYDHESEYPESSGWSFTQYYFPSAFSNEFRLENYANMLFDIFIKLRKQAGITTGFEIPMQYMTLTIDYVLKRYGIEGEDLNQVSFNQWIDAIKHSGYIEAELVQIS